MFFFHIPVHVKLATIDDKPFFSLPLTLHMIQVLFIKFQGLLRHGYGYTKYKVM